MPITLKPNQIKYKGSNGEYNTLNVLADQTTQSKIESITQAGTTQVSEIVKKGTETLASIPENYQKLQDSVNQFEHDVILAQDNQPTSQHNRIWVKSGSTEVVVPTYEEFEALDERLSGTVEEKIDKPAISDNNKFPRAKNGNVEWVEQGLPTDEQTESAVQKWLNAHPDATTTVQDGSLTESKLADALALKTIKDYATPQMYNAYGDGLHDDTTAIQTAINNHSIVFFPKGTYKILSNIVVGSGKILIGEDNLESTILSVGCSAVKFGRNAERCTVSNLNIDGRNGGIHAIDFTCDTYATGIKISNCRISGYNEYSAVFKNGISGFINNIIIDNCAIIGNGNNNVCGIEMINSNEYQVNAVWITHTDVEKFNTGIAVSGCNINIDSNTIQGHNVAIAISSDFVDDNRKSSYSRGINITNNYFELIKDMVLHVFTQRISSTGAIRSLQGLRFVGNYNLSPSINQQINPDNAVIKLQQDAQGLYFAWYRITGGTLLTSFVYHGNSIAPKENGILIDCGKALRADSSIIVDSSTGGDIDIAGNYRKVVNAGSANIVSRYQFRKDRFNLASLAKYDAVASKNINAITLNNGQSMFISINADKLADMKFDFSTASTVASGTKLATIETVAYNADGTEKTGNFNISTESATNTCSKSLSDYDLKFYETTSPHDVGSFAMKITSKIDGLTINNPILTYIY